MAAQHSALGTAQLSVHIHSGTAWMAPEQVAGAHLKLAEGLQLDAAAPKLALHFEVAVQVPP